MAEFVHKKPHKVAILGAIAVFASFFVTSSLGDSTEWKVLALMALATMSLILLVGVILTPFLSGVTLIEGRIEEVLPFGGVVSIHTERIDFESSSFTPECLVLVSDTKQQIVISNMQYTTAGIRRVAEYAGIQAIDSWVEF